MLVSRGILFTYYFVVFHSIGNCAGEIQVGFLILLVLISSIT